MARPLNASSVGDRTDDVRRSAARLFEQSGYSATTMSEIADAVGILPGSLYNHFASKEEIAVDLLAAYNRELAVLGAAAGSRDPTAEPESLIRRLAADVATLAFRHAAAVRLSAYDAPSVSTERFTEAIQYRSPALERAWRVAVQSLVTAGIKPAADLGLLRFALRQMTSHAPLHYPNSARPGEIAAQLCDVLLHGLVVDPPPYEELDGSAAHKAALDAVARWGSRGRTTVDSATDDILAAARSEFARRGYEATTIRDVAAAAGVGMATLYRRVESKEALLKTIVDAYALYLDDAFDAVLPADSTEPQHLYGLARVFGYATRRFREESRIVMFGWFGREAASSPVHDYFVATGRRLDAMAELFRRGVESGVLRNVAPPEQSAVHFRSVLWLRFHEHARTSEDRAFDFLRQSLIQGSLAHDRRTRIS